MKKGMNVWSLPGELKIEDQFKLCKQAGFDTIELNLTENNKQDNLVNKELALEEKIDLTLTSTENELEYIKSLSKKYKLPISSISTSLHWNYCLNSEEKELREKGIEVAKKMIQFCHFLGGDTVLIVPGVIKPTNDYEKSYITAQESLQEIAKVAEKLNIYVGIENVWNKFLLTPLEMKSFIDGIHSSNVGAYFDIGNILQYGFPHQWIEVLGKRIFKIHVKDYSLKIGNINGFTQLLQGDIDWETTVKSLVKIGYDGPLTCELSPYNANGEQLAFDSCKALEYIISLKENGGISNG